MSGVRLRRTKIEHLEPSGDYDVFRATFERDGERVEKLVRYGGVMRALGIPEAEIRAYACMMAAREADRYLAFLRHGADWRQHIELGGDGMKTAVELQRDAYERALVEILELASQGEGRICRTIAERASAVIEPPAPMPAESPCAVCRAAITAAGAGDEL